MRCNSFQLLLIFCIAFNLPTVSTVKLFNPRCIMDCLHRSNCLVLSIAVWCFTLHPNLGQAQQILFIGNSFTGANSLSDWVSGLLKTYTGTQPNTSVIVGGGTTWEQYARGLSNPSSTIYALLGQETEQWDFVILQEQSQTPGFYAPGIFCSSSDMQNCIFDLSAQGLTALAAKVRAVNGNTILWSTWGREDGDPMNAFLYPNFLEMNFRISEGYRRYQRLLISDQFYSSNAVSIAPSGPAYQLIYNDPVGVVQFSQLYADGSHPSLLGTQLSAYIIAGTILGTAVQGPSYYFSTVPEEAATWEYLQRIAAEVLSPITGCTPHGYGFISPGVNRYSPPACAEDVECGGTCQGYCTGGSNGVCVQCLVTGQQCVRDAECCDALQCVAGACSATVPPIPVTQTPAPTTIVVTEAPAPSVIPVTDETPAPTVIPVSDETPVPTVIPVTPLGNCGKVGSQCTDTPQCCLGASCVDGSCMADVSAPAELEQCSTTGGNCTGNGDCCRGTTCTGGSCSVTSKQCSTVAAPCRDSSSCCYGLACYNGNCISLLDWLSGGCTPDGGVCFSSGDCCTGSFCVGDKCEPVSDVKCALDGAQCQEDANCCTGSVCVSSTCRSSSTPDCGTGGASCTKNSGCCGESVCNNGQCTLDRASCHPNGVMCAYDGQCCEGSVCTNGVCKRTSNNEPPQCKESGGRCVLDWQCCVGTACDNGVCTVFKVSNTGNCAPRYAGCGSSEECCDDDECSKDNICIASGSGVELEKYQVVDGNGNVTYAVACDDKLAMDAAQRFTFALQSPLGLCVHPLPQDDTGLGLANGALLVEMDGCEEDEIKFTMRPSGALQHVDSGMCIQPQGRRRQPQENATLMLWSGCDFKALAFEFTEQGSLRHLASGNCVDFQDGDDIESRLILQSECNLPSQVFNLTNLALFRRPVVNPTDSLADVSVAVSAFSARSLVTQVYVEGD